MRKFFTTLFIVAGFYSTTFAQQKSSTEFGFDVGLNSSYVINGNSQEHSSTTTGFNAGVSADHYFSDAWSLKVKVLYDQKGWGGGYVSDDQGDRVDGVTYKLDYITIPVTANWHFGRTGNWYLDFGPYVGFLNSAKVTDGTNSLDVTDGISSTDGGIALGIGVKIPLSNGTKFFIEYDGQGGVVNVVKDNPDGSTYQNIRESFNIGIDF